MTIPVMAKCRIGHFVEAQILQALEIDYIDESEVLTPADIAHHVDKWEFDDPVRLRRDEPRRGAAPDRRGRRDDPDEGRGRHRRRRQRRHAHARGLRRHPAARLARARRSSTPRRRSSRRAVRARQVGAPRTAACRRHFTAGGIATPADARSACSSAPTASSSARASSSPATRALRAEGDRRGDDALPRRRASSRVSPRGSASRWSASRRRARPRAAARDPRLVDRRDDEIGVLAVQGNFREHAAMLRALGADVVEVRHARAARRASTGSSSRAASRPRSCA